MRLPMFEVTSAASAEGRLLVSVATIRSLTDIPATDVDDQTLAALIHAALAQCAKSCRLETYRARPPTLARESVRATWTPDCWEWPHRREPRSLLLPWRAPITSLSITENGAALVEGAEFRLQGAGVVDRVGRCWQTSGQIVVDYVAGFVPLADDPADQFDGLPLPLDLVSLVADQVRMAVDRRDIDLNVRQEDVAGVWSGSYNVAGGSAVDTSGLMRPLYEALSPYRAPPSVG